MRHWLRNDQGALCFGEKKALCLSVLHKFTTQSLMYRLSVIKMILINFNMVGVAGLFLLNLLGWWLVRGLFNTSTTVCLKKIKR